MDFHRRIKKLNDEWWWISILKNASTTMESITTEEPPSEDAKYFAIIRHPVERLVSCWENKGDSFKQDTFREFIEHVARTPDGVVNAHAQSQIAFIDRAVDCYVPMFRLNAFLSDRGCKKIPHRNQSRGQLKYLNYMTPELFDIVEVRYKEDFDLWDNICHGTPLT